MSDYMEKFLKSQEELEKRRKESLKLFKTYMITFLVFLGLLIGAIIVDYIYDNKWTDIANDVISGTFNVISIVYISFLWRKSYKDSKIDEQKQIEDRKKIAEIDSEIKQRYIELGIKEEFAEINWFDHKRSRRTMNLLYLACIAANLLSLVAQTVGW